MQGYFFIGGGGGVEGDLNFDNPERSKISGPLCHVAYRKALIVDPLSKIPGPLNPAGY